VTPLEIYCITILHPGCALPPIGETESRRHKWSECPSKEFFRRIARKHQHKLNNNGLAIGEWISKEKLLQLLEGLRTNLTEDAVLDLMDVVDGWTSPHGKLRPKD
jgi:hypothetical protein